MVLENDVSACHADGRMANNGLVLLPRSAGCSYRLLTKSDYPGDEYGKLLVRFVDKSPRMGK